MNIITEVDEYFLRSKVNLTYPSILIESNNVDALPLLMQSLEEGDVSVIFKYDRNYNVIKKKISRSAYTLKKLLQVFNYTIMTGPNKKFPIRETVDILEVGDWTQ